MRKYTTYRRCAPTRKRYTARSPKIFPFLKFVFCVILIGVLVGGIYVGLHKGYAAFMQTDVSNWKVKNTFVGGMNGALQKEIETYAQTFQGSPFTAKDAYNLRMELTQKYPMLKDIAVTRKLVSGTLKIVAKMREPVAQFKLPDGTVKYVDKDSNVYTDTQAHAVASVELIGQVPEKLRPDFIDLVQSTLRLDKQLDFQTLRMNLTENTVMMVLPDQTVLDFGPAQQLKQKAQRAVQVLHFAREHYKGPYQLNFRFFDKGKVFLTHPSN